MKKEIFLSFLIFIYSTSGVFSKNDLYEKIDLFGEVLENIKKEWVPILVNHNSSDKEGNMELTNRGAQIFPEILDDKFIKSLASKEKIKRKIIILKKIIKSR